MNITELNRDNYEEFTSEGIVLIDIWSPACGPCKALSPIIDEVADTYKGKVSVGKLNTIDNRDLAVEMGIRSIPTLIIYKDGIKVGSNTGFTTRESVIELLEKNLN